MSVRENVNVDETPMHIAIDGPAGAGKSTVCKQVATRLGILFLDTGAMYRAATIGLFDNAIDLTDADAVAAYVVERTISFDQYGDVCLDGISLGERIRTPHCTAEIYRVANNPRCRAHLVTLQQAIVAGNDAALEGRDTTTVICPQAQLKVYLDASAEERARRRLQQWLQEGHHDNEQVPSLENIIEDIQQRDQRDTQREVGALRIADDAYIVHTDDMTAEEVIDDIAAEAVRRCSHLRALS